MVVLLRRLTGLIVAVLLIGLAVSATAMADGRAVLKDYEDNGQVDACYTDAEFVQALDLARADQQQYGAALDVIEQKQLECSGQSIVPGTVTAPTSSGGGPGVLWIIVGIAAVAGLSAFAYVAWVRRRPGPGEE